MTFLISEYLVERKCSARVVNHESALINTKVCSKYIELIIDMIGKLDLNDKSPTSIQRIYKKNLNVACYDSDKEKCGKIYLLICYVQIRNSCSFATCKIKVAVIFAKYETII